MSCACNRRLRDMRRAIASEFVAVFGESNIQRRPPLDGEHAPDVRAPGLSIACARARRTSARAALRRAFAKRHPDAWAVAVCKDDGERPYVAMGFEDFLDLLAQWQAFRSLADVEDAP